MARNKPWTRDELILAMDLYLRIPPARFSTDELQIQELSEWLNRFPLMDGENREENYRSPDSVTFKLNNLRYVDTDGERGLRGASKLDQVICEEFVDDQHRLQQAAESIKAWLEAPEFLPGSSDDQGDEDATEGRILTRVHQSRERNRKLVQRKKTSTLEKQGRLACEACEFDFSKVYGERGEGFIECHHTRPVHTLEPGSKTRLKDLALLCANCHRMVHAQRPWLSVDELKALINTKT